MKNTGFFNQEQYICVETRDFFRPPEESPTGASYHWNSNAETYFLIGDSMGKTMKDLLHETADRE